MLQTFLLRLPPPLSVNYDFMKIVRLKYEEAVRPWNSATQAHNNNIRSTCNFLLSCALNKLISFFAFRLIMEHWTTPWHNIAPIVIFSPSGKTFGKNRSFNLNCFQYNSILFYFLTYSYKNCLPRKSLY